MEQQGMLLPSPREGREDKEPLPHCKGSETSSNVASKSRDARRRRRKESSRRSVRRQNQSLQYQKQYGEGEGSSTYVQFQGKNDKNYQIPRMSYEDIREHMTRT